MGRPRVYESDEALQNKVDEYFEWIKGEKEGDGWKRFPEPATVTGLALYLGFESRQSFYDYENNSEFSYTIKRARTKIECEYEKKLSAQSPTGAIFALKNLGWKDKTEQDINQNMNLSWNEIKSYDPDEKTNQSS